MLFDWILLYIFSITLCLLFIRPIWLGFILFFVLIIVYRIYINNRIKRTHIQFPKYNDHQLYNELKHGDILFSHPYDCHNFIMNFFLRYFNYSLSHGSLIVEENGEKYIIEGNPGNTDKYVCSKFTTVSGHWTITKFPLLEYLKINLTSNCVVFRKDDILLTNYTINEPSKTSIYYCTMVIGDILEKNNIIKKSNRLLRYRPTELIDLVKEAGYKSFYFIKH